MRFTNFASLLLLMLISVPRCADAEAPACIADATSLCLQDDRFQVTVSWQHEGATGDGQAQSLTGDSGLFWFFDADNLELLVKVVDGRTVNGAFWVFYGALTNVEYTISVTELETGRSKSYVNPSGTQASKADTNAFPALDPAAAGIQFLPAGLRMHLDREAFPEASKATLAASFVFTPASPVTVGTQVHFTDTSAGEPNAWCWRFGDSNASCDSRVQNPTHIYTTPSEEPYRVRLEVRRVAGQSANVSRSTSQFLVVRTVAGPPPCSFSVTAVTSTSFTGDGGEGTLKVSTSDTPCPWTLKSKSSFVKIESGANGSGGGTSRYSVLENTTGQARTGTIQLLSADSSVVGNLSVMQAAKPCATLSSEGSEFTSAGGTGEIQVDAPSNCKWTAASNSSFLTITAGASGKGDGTVKYGVQANSGHVSRNGTLTVGDRTFTVAQAGAPCVYTVTPGPASFEALGGIGTVSIATAADCTWQATAADPFLAIGTGSGKGNGTIQYCVAANRDAARSGALEIGGETVDVVQDGPPNAPPAGCAADPGALCLLDRFEARIVFRDGGGQNRAATAVSLTPNTGYFYFFDPENVELLAKLLDGRSLNDFYWFFYGSVSDIAYAITLHDTSTEASKLYCNQNGTLKSVGDTAALPGE